MKSKYVPSPHGLGASSLTEALTTAGKGIARDAVKRVTLYSQVGSYTYDPTRPSAAPRQQSGGASSNLLMSAIKPMFVAETSFGTFRSAPWGEPKHNLVPVAALATGATLVLAGVGAYTVAKAIVGIWRKK